VQRQLQNGNGTTAGETATAKHQRQNGNGMLETGHKTEKAKTNNTQHNTCAMKCKNWRMLHF